MIFSFLKGIIMGVIVSAPMGPVGMLCVRRTLMRGRRHGMITGLGAMLSDILYAIMTMVGVGAFVDFVSTHEAKLQLIGSVLVILFAIYVLVSKSEVVESVTHHKPHSKSPGSEEIKSKNGDAHTFWSAFFVTFSNVLIVLLYIGLLAQFQPLSDGPVLERSILCVAGIGTGALGWWYGVTTILGKMRSHFSDRSLRVMNLVLGCLLLLFGVAGIWDSLSGTKELPKYTQNIYRQQ